MIRSAIPLCVLLVCGLALADDVVFDADLLVRLERVSDPQLSPDGKRLVYVVRETDFDANRGVNGIWSLDLEARNAQAQRLSAGEHSSHSPRWSPDGSQLYFLSSRSGSSQVWRLDQRGGEARQVTDLPLDVDTYLVAPAGRRLAVSMSVFMDCETLECSRERIKESEDTAETGVLHTQMFVRHWDTWKDGRRSQLFVQDLNDHHLPDGEPRHVSAGIDGDIPSRPFGGADEITFSPDASELVFAARVAGAGEPWSTNFDLYRVSADGSAAAVNLTEDNRAWDTHPVYSPDGRYLLWLAMKRPGFEADRFGIMLRDLRSGETREVAPDWDRSPGHVAFTSDGRRLLVTANDTGRNPLFSIDLRNNRVETLESHGDVGGFSVHDDRVVYSRADLKSPAQLFSRRLRGGDAQQLTQLNAVKLAGVEFGDYEQFSFAGWNDETVYGYVVKPVGFEEGTLYPIAFIIHGGPQGSMGEGFHYRWNPQTYAAAGMAVVFIDFHGSTGYGQAFTDSITEDWGGKPLEDLQKGLAYAVNNYDFLDGDRACALGASYGGYMINWIAGQWPDRFRCLVNHSGLFDNRSMYYATEELWFVEWEHGGPQFENQQAFERYNPVNHVDKWQTPMLVVHGALDFRVPLEQGLGTFTALQRRGIESEFLYFPDENHWILKPANSVQWHSHVKRWLNSYLQEPQPEE